MPGSFPKSPKEGFRRRAHGIILRMLIREKSSMADSGEAALLDFLLPGALLPVWELSAPCIFVPGILEAVFRGKGPFGPGPVMSIGKKGRNGEWKKL